MITLKINPLSVNKAWQGRRVKTGSYRDYEDMCLWLLNEYSGVHGWVEIKYNFYIKNYLKADVDNFVKPLTDIVVKAGLIDDDRFIKRMVIEKFKSTKEYVELEIKKYE